MVSTVDPSQIVTVAKHRNGQMRLIINLPFPPTVACQIFVMKDGISNNTIAVVKSKVAVSNPKLTVGRPRPIMPLMLPASKNAPIIMITVSVSFINFSFNCFRA